MVVLRRERKWLAMIDGWEKYMNKNYKKVCAGLAAARGLPGPTRTP